MYSSDFCHKKKDHASAVIYFARAWVYSFKYRLCIDYDPILEVIVLLLSLSSNPFNLVLFSFS